jgi:predicted nucleic acid-binding protein
MTPESCIREAWERRGAWNRRNIPDARLSDALAWLAQEVLVVEPQSAFRDREGEASALTPDADDVPVIALALQVRNEGVWTFNTKDFSLPELLARIRVLTTDDVRSLLAEPR